MPKNAEQLLKASRFTSVPFHPVPQDKKLVWAGSEDTKERLLRLAREVRHGEMELSHLILIFGEYGSGKTHSMKFLQKKIADEGKVITAYLEKPKVEKKGSFHGIVKEVIKQIGERPLKAATKVFVDYITKESQARAFDSVQSEGTGGGDLSEKIKERTEHYRQELQESLAPNFPEIFNLFGGLLRGEVAAWQYFAGKPTAKSLGAYGLNSPMEDDHDALRALSAVISVLTAKYDEIPETPVYQAAYLFVDEIEQLLEMKAEEVLSVRTGLRDIFNACTEHFMLMLAATAETASLFHGLLEEALMVRITTDPVHMRSHDEVAEGVAFLSELMESYRSEAPPTKDHPFTVEALKAIVDRTSDPKTARRLITNARRVWEESEDLIVGGGVIEQEHVGAVANFL